MQSTVFLLFYSALSPDTLNRMTGGCVAILILQPPDTKTLSVEIVAQHS